MSGMLIEGQVREMAWIRLAGSKQALLGAKNNEPIVLMNTKQKD